MGFGLCRRRGIGALERGKRGGPSASGGIRSKNYRLPPKQAPIGSAQLQTESQKVTRKNGVRKLMKTQILKWCGEGDLNPHALSSASTSS